MSTVSTAPKELTITRTFDAPVELVWKAWTEPEGVMRWWGPRHFTSPTCRIDLREGGRYIFHMRAPQDFGGGDYYSAGVFTRIVPYKRLEFTQVLADADGSPVDPAAVGMPADFPADIRVVVTFRDLGGRTELAVSEIGWTQSSSMYANSVEGMGQSLDKLAESLKLASERLASAAGGRPTGLQILVEPGRLDLTIIQEFSAPRARLFQAYTDPELYLQWLGPRYLKMNLEKFEPWSGGSWRYVQSDPVGNSYAFHGVNHEVTTGERIISTFEFEGLPEPGHVVLEIAEFEDLPGGGTRIVSQSVYRSLADRDGMIAAGMESGVVDSYERLKELVEG